MTQDQIDEAIKSLIEICAKLPAHRLDDLIQALGAIRVNTNPSVQMMPNDLAPAADDPALKAGVRADGRLEISIRSPAFGWQKFTLSNNNTTAIGEHFILTKAFWEKAQHLSVHKATGTLM